MAERLGARTLEPKIFTRTLFLGLISFSTDMGVVDDLSVLREIMISNYF